MDLVVVSNRTARPRSDAPMEGGLAAALLPAVKSAGAIWVGASGRLAESTNREGLAKIEPVGAGAIASVDLPQSHHSGFYRGFSNSALWPVLHSRPDLVQIGVEDYGSYRSVNAFMARILLRFARPETLFWIHDYHFFTLAAELRQLGIRQRIGFFLHTPFPPRRIFCAVPNHRELVLALLSNDLIGFQTDEDRDNFADYLANELGMRQDGSSVSSGGRTVRLASFPIGIDPDEFARRAAQSAGTPELARLRASLQGAVLAVGVDRIDYSKGLPHRLLAFDRMLRVQPALKRQVRLLQIAVPSRQQIAVYRRLYDEVAQKVSEINGQHGEVDWTPIQLLARGFSQEKLAGLYRTARVGLVTPFQDGMNLVAKEYVASQNPLDPGVLVLSRFAGAAKQLDAAVLVNPHDIEGMACSIAHAFRMPVEERRERWETLMARLRESPLQTWFSDFIAALRVLETPLELVEEEAIGLVPKPGLAGWGGANAPLANVAFSRRSGTVEPRAR